MAGGPWEQFQAPAAQPAASGPWEQYAQNDPGTEGARKNFLTQQIPEFLRNVAAGALKIPGNVAAGTTGLLGKLTDKIGVTKGLEQSAQRSRDLVNTIIDAKMGANEQAHPLSQFAGETAGSFALPMEKLAEGPSALMQLMKLNKGAADAAGSIAANTGLGAAEGETHGEAGTGAAIGLAGSALGELMKAGGAGIIKGYVKGGHKGKAEGLDMDWAIANDLGGTAEGMTAKAEKLNSDLRNTQQQVVAANAKAPIQGFGLLDDIEQQINTHSAIAKNLGDHQAAQAQLNKYLDDYAKIMNPQTGEVPLDLAWEFKKKAANDASNLYKAYRSGGDTKSQVANAVSASVAEKVNDAISSAVGPQWQQINDQFAKTIPFAKAIARRNVIAGQHNPIGLDELAALDAGVNFMVHGHPEGGILPLVQWLSKSPGFGQMALQAGRKIPRAIAPAADATSALMSLVNPQAGGSQQ